MSTHIKIDELSCALTGYCVRVAPELFEIVPGKDWVDVKHEHVEDAQTIASAQEAEANCPTGAIVLDET